MTIGNGIDAGKAHHYFDQSKCETGASCHLPTGAGGRLRVHYHTQTHARRHARTNQSVSANVGDFASARWSRLQATGSEQALSVPREPLPLRCTHFPSISFVAFFPPKRCTFLSVVLVQRQLVACRSWHPVSGGQSEHRAPRSTGLLITRDMYASFLAAPRTLPVWFCAIHLPLLLLLLKSLVSFLSCSVRCPGRCSNERRTSVKTTGSHRVRQMRKHGAEKRHSLSLVKQQEG